MRFLVIGKLEGEEPEDQSSWFEASFDTEQEAHEYCQKRYEFLGEESDIYYCIKKM